MRQPRKPLIDEAFLLSVIGKTAGDLSGSGRRLHIHGEIIRNRLLGRSCFGKGITIVNRAYRTASVINRAHVAGCLAGEEKIA